MPYDSIDELPNFVKKYSERIQKQYVNVFNDVYKRVLQETNSKDDAEIRANKAARAVLSKRFKKENLYEINTREDYFNFLIDTFVKNI